MRSRDRRCQSSRRELFPLHPGRTAYSPPHSRDFDRLSDETIQDDLVVDAERIEALLRRNRVVATLPGRHGEGKPLSVIPRRHIDDHRPLDGAVGSRQALPAGDSLRRLPQAPAGGSYCGPPRRRYGAPVVLPDASRDSTTARPVRPALYALPSVGGESLDEGTVERLLRSNAAHLGDRRLGTRPGEEPRGAYRSGFI